MGPKIVCSRLARPEIHPRFGIAIDEICARMRSDKPTDEIACWWEETTITTHLRVAAGGCALSLGLLVGSAGGAVAVANTESASSGAHSQGSAVSSPSLTPASGSLGNTSSSSKHPIRTTIQNVLNQLRSFGQPTQTLSTNTTVTADTTTGSSSSNVSTVNAPAATGTNSGAANSNNTAPLANSNPSPNPSPASDDLAAPTLKVVQPVTNAAVTVATVVESVPGVILSLPGSPTPVADVITAMQDMLTEVDNAIAPLVQVPADLYALMGVASANATTIYAGDAAAALSTTPGTPLAPQLSTSPGQVPPVWVTAGGPLGAGIMTPAILGGIAAAGLSHDLSLSGTARVATDGVAPPSAMSFLEHTVRAVLAPASLSALAAIALPGIGGLLVVCAAGMRLGYRQAKAAFAARSSGIARFAHQGPIGVVRAGSLIALHPRSSDTKRPRALRAVRAQAPARLLEQVA